MGADTLGQALWYLLPKFDGGNRKKKLTSLWKDIQTFYDVKHIDRSHRLSKLTPDMLKKAKRARTHAWKRGEALYAQKPLSV